MDGIEVLSIAGSIGTLGFGILSLYQWTALSALKKAIRAHSQTSWNNFWTAASEVEQLSKVVMEKPENIDCASTLKRCSAVNATTIAGRHEIKNFAVQWAAFVPFHETAWEPKPME